MYMHVEVTSANESAEIDKLEHLFYITFEHPSLDEELDEIQYC